MCYVEEVVAVRDFKGPVVAFFVDEGDFALLTGGRWGEVVMAEGTGEVECSLREDWHVSLRDSRE